MKNELLNVLQVYHNFVVCHSVDLLDKSKLGICQVSIYDHVKLHWNDSVFKFWYGDESCSDNRMFIDSNIRDFSIGRNSGGGDKITVHIKNCPEAVEIVAV